jgi:hypothetical protein
MRARVIAACVMLSGALSACGKPDNSGIFVANSERQATLVQLVQTPDGRLTGRVEEMAVQAGGQIKDDVEPLDGAASRHDLTLTSKPVSFLPGVSMTGKVDGDTLTLVGQGTSIQARRSSLDGYQAAVARLRTLAQTEQRQAAEARAAQEARAAESRRIMAIANTTQSLGQATTELRDITAKFNAGVANAPDFGQRAAVNTARVNELARRAATISGLQRSQLAVDANQVIVDTNQVQVARNQYGIELGQVAQPGGVLANRIDAFCASPAPQFVEPCKAASTAAADFKAAYVRGKAHFQAFDQGIKAALNAQSATVQRMAGG